jgi:hypothetical protein
MVKLIVVPVIPLALSEAMKTATSAISPSVIVYFERIIFATLLLGVLQSYLSWDRVITSIPGDHSSAVALNLIILIFTFVIIGTLTLFVSRNRSKIALWISIAMFILGIPPFVQIIIRGEHQTLSRSYRPSPKVWPMAALHSIRATLDEPKGRDGQGGGL